MLNYQRVNISSETNMVTLQVSSETTAAHGTCSPWSSSKLPPCLPVSRAGRCQRTASILPKLAPANEFEMANYMIKWYPMISNDSACTAPKSNNIWSICDILPHLCAWHSSGKNNLKLAVFMCSRTMLTTYYTQLRSFCKGFLLLLRMFNSLSARPYRSNNFEDTSPTVHQPSRACCKTSELDAQSRFADALTFTTDIGRVSLHGIRQGHIRKWRTMENQW